MSEPKLANMPCLAAYRLAVFKRLLWWGATPEAARLACTENTENITLSWGVAHAKNGPSYDCDGDANTTAALIWERLRERC